MGRSLSLGSYAGIPLKLHWTFGLLILVVIYLVVQNSLPVSQVAWFLLYVFSLFFCVVLHEFGHALSAKKYGIKTHDITLSPIGGLARLVSLPEKPIQELVVAIAGPLVNLVLAIVFLFVAIFLLQMPLEVLFSELISIENGTEYVRTLVLMNVVLFLFNLIPAFPMDGGRILRALLSIKLGRHQSTKIASIIGKSFAVLFFVVGIFSGNYVISMVAIFVFYMATVEYNQVKIENTIASTPIGNIMNTEYTKIYFHNTMDMVFELISNGVEKSFLIFDATHTPKGSLHHLFIKEAQASNATNSPVAEFTSSKIQFVDSEKSIEWVRKELEEKGLSIVGVKSDGHLVGVVDRHLITNYINSL